MPKVELIYDLDCPNVKGTRENLLLAFSKAGMEPCWVEWDRNAPDSPEYARKCGSPTVLVEGQDIAGAVSEAGANSCRIYGRSGVPPTSLIAGVLRNSQSTRKAGLLGTLAIGPGLGTAIFAKAACPFCYPALAGLLSSFGLGFLFRETSLLIFSALFAGVALFGLFYRAHSRRGLGPFCLGALSVVIAGASKAIGQDMVLYVGFGGLIVASIWNLIPRRSCGSCAVPGVEKSIGASGTSS